MSARDSSTSDSGEGPTRSAVSLSSMTSINDIEVPGKGPHTYLMALDQGTTSSRCIFFTTEPAFRIATCHQLEHEQITPHPGWVEHDPQELLDNCVECINVAFESLTEQDPQAKVAALGLATQRESTVAWSRSSGKALHNVIVWGDVRTEDIVDEFVAKYGKTHGSKSGDREFMRDVTGLPCSTYFSAFKMRWLIDNVPEVSKAAKSGDLMLGTADAWVLYYLTGHRHFETDATNACRTFLVNINTVHYDETLLNMFDIPLKCLPKIRANNDPISYGKIVAGDLAKRLRGIRITGCIGDQMAALVGHTCFDAGQAKNTYGTGCFLLANVGDTPKASSHGLLSTVGFQIFTKIDEILPDLSNSSLASPTIKTDVEYPIKRQYALEGAIGGAGSMMQWIRDKLHLYHRTTEVDRIAKSVPDTGGVVVVPAFGGLLAPYWRPHARGSILGLTLESTHAHVVRAALEGVAHQVRDVVASVENDAEMNISVLSVDGGLANSKALMQIQADFLPKMKVEVPEMLETTARGAVILAALGIGMWESCDEIKEAIAQGEEKSGAGAAEVLKPKMSEEKLAHSIHLWEKALDKASHWTEHE